MSNPQVSGNNNTRSNLVRTGIGGAAGLTAAAVYTSVSAASVAAPAVGTGVLGAAGVGAGIGSALWGAAAAIPGLVGFGSGGIAAGSWAASLMSASAIANGGVAAGSLVAIGQSIGAAGLAMTTGPVIVGAAAIAGAGVWVGTAAAAPAVAATSGVVTGGVGVAVGAAVGYIFPTAKPYLFNSKTWILYELQTEEGDSGEKIEQRIFGDEDNSRKAFDESSASYKLLVDFKGNVLQQYPVVTKPSTNCLTTRGGRKVIYFEEMEWVLHKLCAVAGHAAGKVEQHIFDDEEKARKAFDESSANYKMLIAREIQQRVFDDEEDARKEFEEASGSYKKLTGEIQHRDDEYDAFDESTTRYKILVIFKEKMLLPTMPSF